MSEFLSNQWFEELNDQLRASAPAPLPEGARPFRVVIDISDVPEHLPRAITMAINDEGARVAPGDSLDADTTLRLSYLDAAALASGQLDSASALREGRIKVRGDVNVLVPFAAWLHAALTD